MLFHAVHESTGVVQMVVPHSRGVAVSYHVHLVPGTWYLVFRCNCCTIHFAVHKCMFIQIMLPSAEFSIGSGYEELIRM